MTIQVYIKSVYGNELVYPHCEQAKLMAKLAKTSTLTPKDIAIIKSMGYAITVVSQYAGAL